MLSTFTFMLCTCISPVINKLLHVTHIYLHVYTSTCFIHIFMNIHLHVMHRHLHVYTFASNVNIHLGKHTLTRYVNTPLQTYIFKLSTYIFMLCTYIFMLRTYIFMHIHLNVHIFMYMHCHEQMLHCPCVKHIGFKQD